MRFCDAGFGFVFQPKPAADADLTAGIFTRGKKTPTAWTLLAETLKLKASFRQLNDRG